MVLELECVQKMEEKYYLTEEQKGENDYLHRSHFMWPFLHL